MGSQKESVAISLLLYHSLKNQELLPAEGFCSSIALVHWLGDRKNEEETESGKVFFQIISNALFDYFILPQGL